MNTRIVVWHLNPDLAVAAGMRERLVDATLGFSDEDGKAAKALWEAHCYVPVAIKTFDAQVMTAEGLAGRMEWMFEKTNHIDNNWTRGSEFNLLILPAGTNHRSTSVGDVMQVNDSFAIRLFRVAPAGFEPMGEWKRV